MPEPRDNRCPECGSDDPAFDMQGGTGFLPMRVPRKTRRGYRCPDPFHTPAPPDHGESEGSWIDDAGRRVCLARDLDQARAAHARTAAYKHDAEAIASEYGNRLTRAEASLARLRAAVEDEAGRLACSEREAAKNARLRAALDSIPSDEA